jgi:hypothetical protein
LAHPHEVAHLAQVDPLRGRQHGANVAPGRGEDERLRHLLGRHAERRRHVRRSLRVSVLEHLVLDVGLVEKTSHVGHRPPFGVVIVLFAP